MDFSKISLPKEPTASEPAKPAPEASRDPQEAGLPKASHNPFRGFASALSERQKNEDESEAESDEESIPHTQANDEDGVGGKKSLSAHALPSTPKEEGHTGVEDGVWQQKVGDASLRTYPEAGSEALIPAVNTPVVPAKPTEELFAKRMRALRGEGDEQAPSAVNGADRVNESKEEGAERRDSNASPVVSPFTTAARVNSEQEAPAAESTTGVEREFGSSFARAYDSTHGVGSFGGEAASEEGHSEELYDGVETLDDFVSDSFEEHYDGVESFEGEYEEPSRPLYADDEVYGEPVDQEREGGENPFLDDGDEFTLLPEAMSQGRYNREEFDASPVDEPFSGFVKGEASGPLARLASESSGAASGEVEVPLRRERRRSERLEDDRRAEPRASEAGESAFDSQLSSLLDEDELSGAPLSGSAQQSKGTDPTALKEELTGESGAREAALARALGVPPAMPAEDREALERFSEEGRARREARKAPMDPLAAGAAVAAARTPLESSMGGSLAEEEVVDASGRGSKKGKSAFPRSKSAGAPEKERYRYMRPNGKLDGAELALFKRMGTSAGRLQTDRELKAMLRGPAGRNESEAERRERLRKVTRVVGGRQAMERGSGFRFGQKERELLSFLAMFRYATDVQLARMWAESHYTTYNRLKKLRQQGLVIDKKLYGARPIWFLTEAGMMLSGYELPRVTEGKLTFSMFPHQFTVNNTAANLWGANVNVLNLDDYPGRFRTNDRGEKTHGEELSSELEIQSSFGRIKLFEKADLYRPKLIASIEREFRDWREAGGAEFGPSPEMLYGNEYMWSLLPPYNLKMAYHVPDLVVKRPRNPDGTPESIAVEIEINNKPERSYQRILRAYRADNVLYRKVIWVCKSEATARRLEKVAKDIGLWQEGRIDIVPIYTEAGVFKERDLWTI
jgi:hypothetical protein